ncbi:MAG: DUF1007 family protein [Pseudomonadota bacterium]
MIHAFPKTSAACLALALASAPLTPAHAHPDFFVKVKYELSFAEDALTALSLDWVFDVFYSDQALNTYDLDGDGAFSADETSALQEEIFAPLADEGYFVRVASGETPEPMQLSSFTPRMEGEQLVLSFTLTPLAPLDYQDTSVAFVTHDPRAYDFSLAEGEFLTVEGDFNALCRFRVEEGTGPLDGLPQTLRLLCPE